MKGMGNFDDEIKKRMRATTRKKHRKSIKKKDNIKDEK